MTGIPGIPRAKLVVARYGPVLAVVAAVVGVVALGGAGWLYANPPTTTVTDQTNEQTVRSTLETSAVVTGNSSLYEAGERVESQPVYFVESMPEATLRVETTVPDQEAVQVGQRVELVMRATSDGETFWNDTRVLERASVTTSDGTVNTTTELDVPDLQEQLAPVRDEIGTAGSLAVFVRVVTAYETDQYAGNLSKRTQLELSGDTYAISGMTLKATKSTPETRQVVLPTRDASKYTIPAGIGATALLTAAVILGLYFRRERWVGVENEIHRNRYDEWISTGSLSPRLGNQYVPVNSLEDLVDVGIDANKRVIYDRDLNAYAVIDGPTIYFYDEEGPRAPGPEPAETDENDESDRSDAGADSDGGEDDESAASDGGIL